MVSSRSAALVPVEHITQSILVMRGQKVLLDAELAALYGVSTKRFNEQVRRNRDRFPADFMFQLTDEEHAALRSQIATLKPGRGQHRKYLPWGFGSLAWESKPSPRQLYARLARRLCSAYFTPYVERRLLQSN